MKRVVLACVGIAALGGVAAAADLPPSPAAPYYKAPAYCAGLHLERVLYRRERRRRLGPFVLDDDQAASTRPAASSAARSATIIR